MAAPSDHVARQSRGEAALHQAVAKAQTARAEAARRIGAAADAEEAEFRARRARERARQALQEADRHDGAA
jgi:hypothetical protein